MTDNQFDELKFSIMRVRDVLNTARYALAELEKAFLAIACPMCGGSGSVSVSDEPCSTGTSECFNCDGKGHVK